MTTSSNRNVAVLGASSNPIRYSFRAVQMLAEKGYNVYPVHPSAKDVDGVQCFSGLKDISDPIDTITVYLGSKNSTPVIDDILNTAPRRVVLNPGAENDELQRRCEEAGIEVQKACTLVMLHTGQF